MCSEHNIRVPYPQLQIDFSLALTQIRTLYLQDALRNTIKGISLSEVDNELSKLVPGKILSSIASIGIRGELLFPVPCLLKTNPRLLGYYRLLFGFSKKEFYSTDLGLSRFKAMEEKGSISSPNNSLISPLCSSLIDCSCHLIEGIGLQKISSHFLDDLSLLTLGPQLRGSANVKRGEDAIVKVFEAISIIVKNQSIQISPTCIELTNAANRKVLIQFSSDPDIIIREEMKENSYRNIIAIEVKGGEDFSNIHNRIGEAEKSHQKARRNGYVECWTVVNVDRVDIEMAHKESPSTDRFFRMSQLHQGVDIEFEDFRNRIISLTGIPTPD